jgi:hypothetical protein
VGKKIFLISHRLGFSVRFSIIAPWKNPYLNPLFYDSLGRGLNPRPGFVFQDLISIASHNTINRLPLWGKGEINRIFLMAALFIFQTFPPLFLGSFGGDLVEGRF